MKYKNSVGEFFWMMNSIIILKKKIKIHSGNCGFIYE